MNVKKMVMVVGILVALMAVGVGRSYATIPGECTTYTATVGECTWYIEKWAAQSELTLAIDEHFEVDYVVTVVGSGTGCPAVDVYDTYAGFLGSASAGETPKQFRYSRDIAYEACGDYVVENTASLSSAVPGALPITPPPLDLCYSKTINVHVPCEEGCTLTQGYWKTHSENGRAPYDDTWLQIGASGSNSTFYLSGMSYYGVLREPPRGNAYYILARQFIAAKLNTLKGASTTPEVEAAIASANTFFMTYGPGAIVSKAVRNQALIDASILDGYNNGYVGPGHCSEQE